MSETPTRTEPRRIGGDAVLTPEDGTFSGRWRVTIDGHDMGVHDTLAKAQLLTAQRAVGTLTTVWPNCDEEKTDG